MMCWQISRASINGRKAAASADVRMRQIFVGTNSLAGTGLFFILLCRIVCKGYLGYSDSKKVSLYGFTERINDMGTENLKQAPPFMTQLYTRFYFLSIVFLQQVVNISQRKTR